MRFNAKLMIWQKRNSESWILASRYTLPCIVIFLTSLFSYPEVDQVNDTMPFGAFPDDDVP